MPQINLSTYEQSEEIKSDLESMLEKIIESSGTNYSKYEPFSFQETINIPIGDTVYKKAFSADGEGYLSSAVLRGDAGGNAVRITVDGKVVLETNANSSSQATGFLMRDYTTVLTGNQLVVHFNGVNYVIPPGTNQFKQEMQNNSIFLSSQFLFFKESILVEFRRIGTSAGGSLPNLISGGIKK